MENFLCEEKGLKRALGVTSLAAGTENGARVELKHFRRIAVVCHFEASASAVLDVSFQQHDAASGGNSKAISIDNMYYHKVGAAVSFTKVEPGAEASSFDLSAVVGNNAAIVVFEILAEDLDVNADFNHISVDFLGDATARDIFAEYIGFADKKPAYSIEM